MTRVRFIRTYAGPAGTWVGGTEADIPDDLATALLEGGTVVDVAAPVDIDNLQMPDTPFDRKMAFLETIQDRDELKGILDAASVEYNTRAVIGTLRKLILASPTAMALIEDPLDPTELEDLENEQLIAKAALSGIDISGLIGDEGLDREVLISEIRAKADGTSTSETGAESGSEGSEGSESGTDQTPRDRD